MCAIFGVQVPSRAGHSEAREAQLEKLQREGRIVAMAGDGINDAPALALAVNLSSVSVISNALRLGRTSTEGSSAADPL